MLMTVFTFISGVVSTIAGFLTLTPYVTPKISEYYIRIFWGNKKLRRKLQTIVANNTIELSCSTNAATFGPAFHVQYFVDLLSSVTDRKTRISLERSLACWMYINLSKKPTKIGVPRLGNILLADDLARRIGVPLVIIRQQEETFLRGNNPFDGRVTQDDRILLVDDVASDPDFLIRCVQQLWGHNIPVVGIFALLEIAEGGSKARFEAHSLKFRSALRLDQNDLCQLYEDHNNPYR